MGCNFLPGGADGKIVEKSRIIEKSRRDTVSLGLL